MDAIEVVLAALREAGIEAFLAYGTLLGAVREGKLLGHDSDADLGYVSHLTHPVDVIRESFRLQRALVGLGYRITRYSALAFKVDVDEGDGVVRGLDVFGGFLMDGHLHLMGEIREPVRGVVDLPARHHHARGAHLPGARRPGQAAHRDVRARGARPTRRSSSRRPPRRCAGSTAGSAACGSAGPVGPDLLPRAQGACPEPSPFVQWVAAASRTPRRTSTSAAAAAPTCLRMAERGVPSFGLDFQPRSYAAAQQRAAADDRLRELVTFWPFNLLELRQAARRRCDRRRRPGAPGPDGPAPRGHAQAAGAAPAVAAGPDDARRRG